MSSLVESMADVEALRVVGRMAAETLMLAGEQLRAGMTTEDIDRIVREDTARRGAKCATLGYHGFPKNVCTSRNHVVCHGIPGSETLEEGDIINVDVTTLYGGFHGDTSATFFIGKPSPEARQVTEVARQCLDIGIAQVRDGAFLGDIGAAIQEHAKKSGCQVIPDILGHGIGREFHAKPSVRHTGKWKTGERLRSGMVFTVEPAITIGKTDLVFHRDGWTITTKDKSLTAQFEHTLIVTKTGYELFTKRPGPLVNSEI